MKERYIEEVKLLLDVLPASLSDHRMALKGGTAISLFYKNLPRLSVDIDLVYLPIEDRKTTFKNIYLILDQLKIDLEKKLKLKVNYSNLPSSGKETKLTVAREKTEIKIEPNFILRGALFEVQKTDLCKEVQNRFGRQFSVQCLDPADVYGGKICAALDRQHPRDLFDLKVLLETENITDRIKDAFIFYLLSGTRPPHEMLDPQEINMTHVLEKDFSGMINVKVTENELRKAQKDTVLKLKSLFTENDKRFLISFVKNRPDWNLYTYPKIKDYPSIKWKMLNQEKMDLKKKDDQVALLEKILT